MKSVSRSNCSRPVFANECRRVQLQPARAGHTGGVHASAAPAAGGLAEPWRDGGVCWGSAGALRIPARMSDQAIHISQRHACFVTVVRGVLPSSCTSEQALCRTTRVAVHASS